MDKQKNNTGFHPVSYEQYSRRSQYRIMKSYKKSKEKQQPAVTENITQDDDTRDQMNMENNNNSSSNDDFQDTNDICHQLFNVSDDFETQSNESDHEHHDSDSDLESTNSAQDQQHSDDSNNEEENMQFENDINYQEDISGDDMDLDDVETDDGDEQLYTGSRLTLGESLLAILAFFLSENLTGVGLVRLLKLVEMHCLTPNKCKKTAFLFKKYFSKIEAPLKRHFYCSNCLSPLPNSLSTCELCPDEKQSTTYFIEISVIDQLQQMYNRHNFFSDLQWRYNRIKMNVNNLEDIYDGNVYKKMRSQGGLLYEPNNISFTWNTDGVSLFKSSNFEIWPLFLAINELPLHLRMKKENLILAGLWFGPKKPLPTSYLYPMSQELNLLKNGVNFNVAAIGRPLHVQGHVICLTCDLPAKSLFLNMLQFNGEYGCAKCKIHVERYPENPRIPVYNYQEELHMRLQRETVEFGTLAVDKDYEHVFGVKALSVINEFDNDYIRHTVVDSMHCIYLGIVKLLLLLWFSPKYKQCKWSISDFLSVVDTLLSLITPPAFITRLPRSIEKHRKYWKAHEYKAWFYYFSLPILETVMRDQKRIYFQHYQLLVNGISLLNQSSISVEMINQAEELLKRFVREFADLYDRQFMSSNLHNLLHLCDGCKDYGPLFVTSCFEFENMNGQLSKLVTGTRFSGLQISAGLAYIMAIPRLLDEIQPESIILSFVNELMNVKKKYKSHKLSEQLYAVGAVQKQVDIPDIILEALDEMDLNNLNLNVFCRLIKSGVLYTSESYLRMTKTNSSYVKYNDNNQSAYGKIHSFVQVSRCTCQYFCENIVTCEAEYFAIIKKYAVSNKFNSSQIHECWLTDSVIAVDVRDIVCVCFYIQINSPNRRYIIEPINTIEKE